MNPESNPTTSRWNRTAMWLVVLIVLHYLYVFIVMIEIPRQKRSFDEFNMQLPPLTKLVLDVGSLYGSYWWLLLPTQLSTTVVGVTLGRHVFRGPTPGNVFAIFILIAMLVFLTFACISMVLPQIKLAEGRFK